MIENSIVQIILKGFPQTFSMMKTTCNVTPYAVDDYQNRTHAPEYTHTHTHAHTLTQRHVLLYI